MTIITHTKPIPSQSFSQSKKACYNKHAMLEQKFRTILNILKKNFLSSPITYIFFFGLVAYLLRSTMRYRDSNLSLELYNHAVDAYNRGDMAARHDFANNINQCLNPAFHNHCTTANPFAITPDLKDATFYNLFMPLALCFFTLTLLGGICKANNNPRDWNCHPNDNVKHVYRIPQLIFRTIAFIATTIATFSGHRFDLDLGHTTEVHDLAFKKGYQNAAAFLCTTGHYGELCFFGEAPIIRADSETLKLPLPIPALYYRLGMLAILTVTTFAAAITLRIIIEHMYQAKQQAPQRRVDPYAEIRWQSAGERSFQF
jgi:hypothetical protein